MRVLSAKQQSDLMRLYDAYLNNINRSNYLMGLPLELETGAALEALGLVRRYNKRKDDQYRLWEITLTGIKMAEELRLNEMNRSSR